MEIEIHKSQTNDTVSLNLLLTWAKDYTDSFDEPDINSTNTDTNEEKTNEFIHSLLSLKGVLVVYDNNNQLEVDTFIKEYLDHIKSCSIFESTYILDSNEFSAFALNQEYINKRISNVEDGLNFMDMEIQEEIENNPDVEHYLFINQFFEFCFEDYNRFISSLEKLLKNPKVHVILTTFQYEYLNEAILKLFQHRIGFWIGSTKVSKALMGTNVLCSPMQENACIYSNDFGESYSTKYFKDEISIEDIDNMLDI